MSSGVPICTILPRYMTASLSVKNLAFERCRARCSGSSNLASSAPPSSGRGSPRASKGRSWIPARPPRESTVKEWACGQWPPVVSVRRKAYRETDPDSLPPARASPRQAPCGQCLPALVSFSEMMNNQRLPQDVGDSKPGLHRRIGILVDRARLRYAAVSAQPHRTISLPSKRISPAEG
jgi:hypothetical protein